MRFIHLLSKEARLRLIELALSHRSAKELADELEISPAAVSKYTNGKMHPSDDTIRRLFRILDQEEHVRAYTIVLEDLAYGLEELLEYVSSNGIDVLSDREFQSIIRALYEYLGEYIRNHM